jgi:hypothetical protein
MTIAPALRTRPARSDAFNPCGFYPESSEEDHASAVKSLGRQATSRGGCDRRRRQRQAGRQPRRTAGRWLEAGQNYEL